MKFVGGWGGLGGGGGAKGTHMHANSLQVGENKKCACNVNKVKVVFCVKFSHDKMSNFPPVCEFTSGVTPLIFLFDFCCGPDLSVQRLLTAWLGPVWSVAMVG